MKAERYASATLSLPKDQANSSTGIRKKTPRHLSRCLLAVTSGLSGSAQPAATGDKLKSRTTADVLFALNKLLERKTKQPTFEAAQLSVSHLLREWDYERSAADGIHPNNNTLGSNKLVHWDCQKCPKGQLHQYQMPACDRTSTRFQGCPYCAGHQVCKCNSLKTLYPMVSSEWDFARNDLTPAQVTSQSHQVIWWVNPVRGTWAQAVRGRTDSRWNPKC